MNSKEHIVQMVKDGTASTKDGYNLFETLGMQSAPTPPIAPVVNVNPARGRKMLRVKVDSAQ